MMFRSEISNYFNHQMNVMTNKTDRIRRLSRVLEVISLKSIFKVRAGGSFWRNVETEYRQDKGSA